MNKWNELPTIDAINQTINNLNKRGINALLVNNAQEAKEKFLELVPQGTRVLASSSKTVEKIGLLEIIEESDQYKSVRKEYMALDHETLSNEIRKIRSTPDLIVASVHAVTRDGEVFIASNTGSQLAAYSAGAGKVIWIVGAQKLVENKEDAFKRIYEYVLPLESERLKKEYGVPSNVSKLLIVNKEVVSDRVTLILVNESLGF